MPKEGVEPSCLSAHEPESCVSANFTTWAQKMIALMKIVNRFQFNCQRDFQQAFTYFKKPLIEPYSPQWLQCNFFS
jgi:hypothetical protein